MIELFFVIWNKKTTKFSKLITSPETMWKMCLSKKFPH